MAYQSLRRLMPADIELCPVELPGRGARMDEPAVRNMRELVEMLSDALRPLLDVPFAFFGHSVGAHIAYEAARRVRAVDGRPAVHLFVSARAAPDRFRPAAPGRDLSDGELLAALRRFGGTPAAVLARDELMVALLPAIRADLALGESCSGGAESSVACPITALGGAEDVVDAAALATWKSFTTNAFRVRMFPGGHFYFSTAPAPLADELVGALSDAARPARSNM